MSLLQNLMAWRPWRVQAAGDGIRSNLTAEELLNLLTAGSTSSSGVAVSPENAMQVAAVYACVDRITGAIKSLPFCVFERVWDEKRGTLTKKQARHDYDWLFNERANADMSAADAWAYLIASKLFHGDGYAELLRPSFSSTRIIGWLPHHPDRVQPFRENGTGQKRYRVTRLDGSVSVLDQADMVQITSLGYDGLCSPSPITYAAREAVGNAIAGQRWSGRFFKEGATFDYALKTAATLRPEQVEALKASLIARAAGSRGPMVLTGGLEPAQLSVNPKDAELLASRQFTVEEICRIFGVPPHLIGHTEKNSSWGTGMEQQGGNFVRYTLMGHLTQIAQEFNHKLWPVRQRFFLDHITAALERGDQKARNEANRIALGRAGEPGWRTVNEVRSEENLPPVDGGDTLNTGAPDAPPTDPTAGR